MESTVLNPQASTPSPIEKARQKLDQALTKIRETFQVKYSEAEQAQEEEASKIDKELDILHSFEQYDARLAEASLKCDRVREVIATVPGIIEETVKSIAQNLAKASTGEIGLSDIDGAFSRIATVQALDEHSGAVMKELENLTLNIRINERKKFIEENKGVLKRHGLIS